MMSQDSMQILGDEVMRDLLSAAPGKFDTNLLVNAAAELASKGIDAGAAALRKQPQAGAPSSPSQPPPPQPESGSSFLTKVHAGIPTWGWLVGGTGIAAGVVMILVKVFRRGRR